MLQKRRAESENKHGNGPLWGSIEENMVGGVGHEDPMSFINMELPKDKDVSIYGFWSVSEVKLGSFLAPCRSATLFCISFLNVHL